MRRLILAAAGLALLVPAALAQTAPAPGAAPAAGAPLQAGGPAPAGGPGLMPPPPPPGGPGLMPPPPPPPSRAAHIHLQRGDAVVDVKCSDDDGTKACADIANAMLDRLLNQATPARN